MPFLVDECHSGHGQALTVRAAVALASVKNCDSGAQKSSRAGREALAPHTLTQLGELGQPGSLGRLALLALGFGFVPC